MTFVTTLRRADTSPTRDRPSANAPSVAKSATRRPLPPLSPRMQVVRAAFTVLLVLTVTLLVQLLVVSGRQQSSSEHRAFDALRAQLAKGTAPIGPTDDSGAVLRMGAPVAFLEIPSIGVQQVVGEGTTPGVLFSGLGHRRDTMLPGQIGTSVIFGRRASYGGPFSALASLKKGAAITVTTGQGTFRYTVLGVRRAGDPVPAAPSAVSSRLVLTTAGGPAFMPNGVIRVDADIDGSAVGGATPLFSAASLPAREREMAGDSRTLWALAFWLQALIALSIAAVWAWFRWGRAQAWIVFFPAVMLVGLAATQEAARLLPNLM